MQDNGGMKTCTGCGEAKPIVNFHRNHVAKDGHQNRCKQCVAAQRRAIAGTVVLTEKFCGRCERTLPIGEFQKNRSARDGHQSYCGQCAYETHRRYLQRNAELVALRRTNKLLTPIDPTATKTCRVCGETKSLTEYHAHRGTTDARATWCKDCAHGNEWPRKLARYGLTPDDYTVLYEAQGGRCAICGEPGSSGAVPYRTRSSSSAPSRLNVDHCHSTGKVRGLLCGLCNTGIGHLRDSPELLRAALRYLEDAMTA